MAEKQKLYDLEYLRVMSDNDDHFVLEMIKYFVKNTPEVIEQMNKLYLEENYQALRDTIHKFSPNLSMIGAQSVVQKANKLETNALNKENLETIPILINEVSVFCRDVLVQLKEDFDIE